MRHIEPKLVTYIDEKLKSNGLAQEAVKNKDARLLFQLAAQCLVGIREVGGNNRGPLVELIQKTIGRAEKEAWCMAFVQSCLAYVEVKLVVKSPLIDSEHCLTVWNDSPHSQRVIRFPLPGAIAIARYGDTSKGHTGILLMADSFKQEMNLVEGNTEGGIIGGKMERDGGGVYYTRRSMVAVGDAKIVGFLKPF